MTTGYESALSPSHRSPAFFVPLPSLPTTQKGPLRPSCIRGRTQQSFKQGGSEVHPLRLLHTIFDMEDTPIDERYSFHIPSLTASLLTVINALVRFRKRAECIIRFKNSTRSRGFLHQIHDCKSFEWLQNLLGTCQKLAGGSGGGNFKSGFGNEVTHPCNGSEIC